MFGFGKDDKKEEVKVAAVSLALEFDVEVIRKEFLTVEYRRKCYELLFGMLPPQFICGNEAGRLLYAGSYGNDGWMIGIGPYPETGNQAFKMLLDGINDSGLKKYLKDTGILRGNPQEVYGLTMDGMIHRESAGSEGWTYIYEDAQDSGIAKGTGCKAFESIYHSNVIVYPV